jgi:[citrate (pro-3S)-lyase] ligase
VKEGTADLTNVLVLRSGKFIISSLTFSVYFTKDNLDALKFDASTDVLFFGKYIAPALHIGVRFVGTEPKCQVTRRYNEQMAEILPQYGVRLEVIERKELMDQVISASLVRGFLETGELVKAKPYIPACTYSFLERYVREKSS